MGRKSKLTEKQWGEVKARSLNGETVASLAREYEISPSSMREKITVETEIIKSLANQIVATEQRKKDVNISILVQSISLAEKIMLIQNNLGDAAVAGSKTAKLISEAALARVELLEGATEEDVKAAMQSSVVANTAGKLGMDLLNLAAKPGAVKQDNTGPGSKLVTLTPEEIKLINEEIENAC